MAEPQLDRLWMGFNQIVLPEEKGQAICSAVGLACTDRNLRQFAVDNEAGIRDGFVFYGDHVVLVRTPTTLGISTMFSLLRKKNASVVVPHERIPRDEILSLEVTGQAPPGWSLTGARFLHTTMAKGSAWFWLDDTVMRGPKDRTLEDALVRYQNADATRSD